MTDTVEYLEAQQIEAKIADAMATIVVERPADAAARLAQLLAPAPPPTDKYLDTVGRTPLIQLSRLLPAECKAKAVYVKMEMQNPGGSIKDRIAKGIIEQAEASGKLKPGMTVVEATSGNTGIGLAMCCAAKGYGCVIVMPQVPPMMERYMIVRQFGAEVLLTAPAKGINGCLKAYNDLVSSDPSKYFGANQFKNEDNPNAHYATTGPEIWSQTSGEVDYFVHGIGTGGCLSGTGKYLKEQKPSVKCVGIEPTNARVHVGAKPAPHTIVGIGAGIPTNFLGLPKDDDGNTIALSEDTPVEGSVDEWAHATPEEAIEYAGKAARLEGMMVGPSAGAALKVALEIACRDEAEGKTIVAILASHGIRYVAHPMWGAIKAEAAAALPVPPNMDKEAEVVQWKSSEYTPK